MIRLEAGVKLQALLGGAVTTTALDVVASYSETGNLANRPAKVGTKLSTLSGATAVDIADSPEPGLVREVDFISVRNNDTASAAVTFRVDDGSAQVRELTVTIATQEMLFYADGKWHCMSATGRLQQ